MEFWQRSIVILFGLSNLVIFFVGYYQSRTKRNPIGLIRPLYPLGMFVWADAVIISVFWILSSMTSFLLNDWILFLLVFSVFWVVRSLGETIFFFNQQFSKTVRVPAKPLPLYKVFQDEYVTWFGVQLMNQCITIISIITSAYLFNLWLK
ncbi:hypothetical protein ACFL0F_02350 [Patescibacteria group bacterium]